MSTLQSGPNQPLPPDVPGGDEILVEVQTKQAHSSVAMHALYGISFDRKSIRCIARLMGKAPSTVSRRVKRWERDRSIGHVKQDPRYRKFGEEHRQWIKEYFESYPFSFLEEAAQAFQGYFNMSISCGHLWAILAEAGFTRKVCQ